MEILEVLPEETIRKCVKLLLGAIVVYWILYLSGLQKLFADDAEGAAALLSIIGTLYSVLYAFATYVIWGQFTAVETAILKESGALKDIILFSERLKPNTREPVVRAIKIYAKGVVESEWDVLSRKEDTSKTDRYFREIIASVTSIKAEDSTEHEVYERLLTMASEASTQRDERLSLSVKRIPRTLLIFVTLNALVILLLLFLYPFRSPVLGTISIAITTILFFFAYFVVTDLDNPFEGTWNVSSDPFGELITKFR